jgi:asparagine synthase (glutamine-hydrolysing)
MRDLVAHRGPDHAGVWRSNDGQVCLGHRRLAIIDLSPDANQPFISRDGRFVITFNGEVYNFRSLRDELRSRGIVFDTQSDTEVLVEAFRQWGDRCLEHLSGMFAFAIWDCETRRLFCARDRAGEKPFYYALINDSFVFASELKSLLRWPGFNRKLNYPALADFLSFGFVPDPKTIWEDAHKLPPAHSIFVEFGPGGAPVVSHAVAYWDLEFDPDYSVGDWGPRILEALSTASQEMAVADVPVGAFLSGGVDSSSVTAALSKAGREVRTFTIGFQESAYDERRWAGEIARQYGTAHTEKVVQAEDVLSVFKKLVWHYDEPFNDYSYLPTFYLCREARSQITVALSGDGADELFAGYRKYQRLGMRQAAERFVPRFAARLVAAGNYSALPEPGRRTLRQYALDAPAMMVDMLTLGFQLDDLRAAARGQLARTLKEYSPADVVYPLLDKAPPNKVGLINSMRYLDLKLTLGADILVKVDRASMAVSLEVRPVYLHRNMLDLAGKIPSGLLANRKQSKKALKDALRTWLPSSVLDRRKMGFAMPLKQWVNGGLREAFTQESGESALDEMLDAGLLQRLTARHAGGDGDMTSVIHSLFFLKRWLSEWV